MSWGMSLLKCDISSNRWEVFSVGTDGKDRGSATVCSLSTLPQRSVLRCALCPCRRPCPSPATPPQVASSASSFPQKTSETSLREMGSRSQ